MAYLPESIKQSKARCTAECEANAARRAQQAQFFGVRDYCEKTRQHVLATWDESSDPAIFNRFDDACEFARLHGYSPEDVTKVTLGWAAAI